jgi:hypothetical protein
LKPEFFATDNAAKYIKVDGQYEALGGDMDAFTQLHKDLDTFNHTSIVPGNNASTAILASTQHHKFKTEDLI